MNNYPNYLIKLPSDTDYLDISDLIDSQKTSLTYNGCNNSIKSSIDTLSFTMKSTDKTSRLELRSYIIDGLLNAIEDGDDIMVKLSAEDGQLYFYGRIDLSNISIETSDIPGEIAIKCDDNSYLLDETIARSFEYPTKGFSSVDDDGTIHFNEGIPVFLRTGESIIGNLLTMAGYKMPDIVPVDSDLVTTKIPDITYDVDTKQTYRDLFNTLLFEHQAVFTFDPDGKFRVKKLSFEDPKASRTIDEFLIGDKIKTSSSIYDNDGVKLTWSTLALMKQGTLYVDSISNNRDDDGKIIGEEIKPGAYYPETGDLEDVFQTFEAKFLDRPYLTNQTRLQNKDLNLISTRNVKHEVMATDTLAMPVVGSLQTNPMIYPTKARYLFYNDTQKSIFLQRFRIQGDTLYRNKLNTYTVPDFSTNPEEYTSQFIYTENGAKEFSNFYRIFRKYAQLQHKWSEYSNPDLFEIVNVRHKKTNVGTMALVISKTITFTGSPTRPIKASVAAIGISRFDVLPPLKQSVTTGSGMVSQDGTAGADAKLLSLSLSATQFSYYADGTLKDQEDIIVTVSQQGIGQPIHLFVNGAEVTTTLGKYTITPAMIAGREFIRVRATCGDQEQSNIITKVIDGSNGADAKSLVLANDTPVFKIQADGEPYPDQIATLNVLKQNIPEQVRWEMTNHLIPGGAMQYKVTPFDMGYGGITLTNNVVDYVDDWLTRPIGSYGLSSIYYKTPILQGHTYYMRCKYKYTTTSQSPTWVALYIQNGNVAMYPMVQNPVEGTEYTIDAVGSPMEQYTHEYGSLYNGDSTIISGVTAQVKNFMCIDITELINSCPSKFGGMSNEQISAWCKTYIPDIKAGESWTIGGRLKNLFDPHDMYDASPSGTTYSWDESTKIMTCNFPNVFGRPDLAAVRQLIKAPRDAVTYARGSMRQTGNTQTQFRWPEYTNVNLLVSSHFQTKIPSNDFLKGGYLAKVINVPFLYMQYYNSVNYGDWGGAITLECKEYIYADLTTSGWLARLSLMGIESKEDVYSFMQSIPFFKDELDFPCLTSLPVTITAGDHTSSTTISVVQDGQQGGTGADGNSVVALDATRSYSYETWQRLGKVGVSQDWVGIGNPDAVKLGDIAVINGVVSDRDNIGVSVYFRVTSIEGTTVRGVTTALIMGNQGEAGKDSRLLRLQTDRQTFQIKADGQPYPNQVAHLQALKQNIAQQVHWDVINRVIPDGTERIEVTPWDLGYGTIELKARELQFSDNISYTNGITLKKTVTGSVCRTEVTALNNVSDSWSWSGREQSLGEAFAGHTYYGRIRIRSNKRCDFNPFTSYQSLAYNYCEPDSEWNDVSVLYYVRPTEGILNQSILWMNCAVMRSSYLGSENIQVGDWTEYDRDSIVIADVTELMKIMDNYSKFTSNQSRWEWCNTYIPYIPAGETWTIGGKLVNLVPNPLSTEGWVAGANIANFDIDGSIIKGDSSGTISATSSNSINKHLSASYFNNHSSTQKHYARINQINATNGFTFGIMWNNVRPGISMNSGVVVPIDVAISDQYRINVGALNGLTHIEVDVSKGMIVGNLVTSGWLAKLSLMGIESDADIKAFMDTIPFFEGELDFPTLTEYPITISAGDEIDTVTLSIVKDGDAVVDFFIRSSQLTYAMTSRSVVKVQQMVGFICDRQNTTGAITWAVDNALAITPSSDGVTATVTIPVGFDVGGFTVTCVVERADTKTLTISGVASGDKTPVYLGELDSAPTETPEGPLIVGDSYLRRDGIPQRYNGVGWGEPNKDDANYSQIMLNCASDILSSDRETIPKISSIYAWFEHLTALNAVLENLFTREITLLGEGFMRSEGYNKGDINNTNKQGFFFDSQGYSEWQYLRAKNASIEGQFTAQDEDGIVLKTQPGGDAKAVECSAKSRWGGWDACASIALGSSGTCTYNGASKAYVRSDSSHIAYLAKDKESDTWDWSDTVKLAGTYNIELSVWNGMGGSARSYYVTINGNKTFYEAPFGQGKDFNLTFDLKVGDTIRIETVEYGYSGYCHVCWVNDGIVMFESGHLPTVFIPNDSNYASTIPFIIGAWNSASHTTMAPITGWYDGIPMNRTVNARADSVVTIDGKPKTVAYVTKTPNSLLLVFTDNDSITFSAPADTADIATRGWYNISGTIYTQAESRGVVVDNLIPSSDATKNIGSGALRFGTVHAVNVNGNVNAQGTSNKVWGAVAN